jgi:hypothetical protein
VSRRGPRERRQHGADDLGGPSVVAFSSDATNLVSGDTNKKSDVFVHDRRRE